MPLKSPKEFSFFFLCILNFNVSSYSLQAETIPLQCLVLVCYPKIFSVPPSGHLLQAPTNKSSLIKLLLVVSIDNFTQTHKGTWIIFVQFHWLATLSIPTEFVLFSVAFRSIPRTFDCIQSVLGIHNESAQHYSALIVRRPIFNQHP